MFQSGADSGDSLIEADSVGNEDALPRQYTRISNATLIGRSTVQSQNMLLIRGGADFALLNSVVTGTLNCVDIDATAGTTARSRTSAHRCSVRSASPVRRLSPTTAT